jgi:hypothetical protein
MKYTCVNTVLRTCMLLSRADFRFPYTRPVLRTADLITVYVELASMGDLKHIYIVICVN